MHGHFWGQDIDTSNIPPTPRIHIYACIPRLPFPFRSPWSAGRDTTNWMPTSKQIYFNSTTFILHFVAKV